MGKPGFRKTARGGGPVGLPNSWREIILQDGETTLPPRCAWGGGGGKTLVCKGTCSRNSFRKNSKSWQMMFVILFLNEKITGMAMGHDCEWLSWSHRS